MVTGHYFTMVKNGFVIFPLTRTWLESLLMSLVISRDSDSSLVLTERLSSERLLPAPSLCINDYSLQICAVLHGMLVWSVWYSQLCSCAGFVILNYACAKLWNSTHSDWSRIGMTSKYTQSMSFSNICSKKAYLEPSAGLIRNQDDGCCDECKKILGSKTINLTNKTIK